jgi:hypothetical protein
MADLQTLHFRVGAEMGIRLAEIAQEHFIYQENIDKALSVFNDSFGGGCPEDLQLALLTGEKIILVDEEQQSFIVVDRSDYMHLDKVYPQLDFNQYFNRKQREMDKTLEGLEEQLEMVAQKFRFSETYRMDFSVGAVVNYLYGDDEVMLEEIRDDYELNQMQTLIRITKEFIEKSFRLAELSRKVNGLYGLDIKFETFHLLVLGEKIRKFRELDFGMSAIRDNEQSVNAYMDAIEEIDEVLSKGIEPVDIMDNYSAGWLSPEGEYYALNGEIANMLHNQIADALQEKGLIPMYDDDREKELDIKTNPDAWLEQHGWVKIHGNNVQFAGNLNKQLGKPIVHLTDKQIEIIRDYITNCHQCLIKAGWRLERTSIGMFTSLAMADKFSLYKKYFDF